MRSVGPPSGGTITFSWGGDSATPINLSGISASTIQTAPQSTTGIAAVPVTNATRGAQVTYYTIAWPANGRQSLITQRKSGAAWNAMPLANRLVPLLTRAAFGSPTCWWP